MQLQEEMPNCQKTYINQLQNILPLRELGHTRNLMLELVKNTM